jgi:hypothetical protein
MTGRRRHPRTLHPRIVLGYCRPVQSDFDVQKILPIARRERWNARSVKSDTRISPMVHETPVAKPRRGYPACRLRIVPGMPRRITNGQPHRGRLNAAVLEGHRGSDPAYVKPLLGPGNGPFRGPPRRHRRLAPAKSAAASYGHPRGSLPGLADCGPAATPSSIPRRPPQQPSP